jgi:hypothetical protein
MRFTALAMTGCVLALHSAVPIQAGVNSWTPTGPEGGFFQAIRHDPSDSRRVFALADRRVFRSVDSGATWTACGTVGSGDAALTDLAVDPRDGNTVYVGADELGFYRSVNGGTTFFRIPSTLTARARYIATSADGAVVYLVHLDGSLLVSTNRGEGWTQQASTLFAGGQDLIMAFALASGSTGVLYAALQDRGIQKSVDGGISWSPANVGIGAEVLSDVTADPSVPDRVFAGTNDGVYVSEDAGGTWMLSSFNNHSAQEIVVDSADSRLMFVRSNGEVFMSTAGAGGVWQEITASLNASDVATISWHSPVRDRILVGTSDGIYATTNGGAEWTASHAGFAQTPTAVLHSATDGSDVIFLGSSQNGAYTTSGNTQSWTSMNSAGLRTAVRVARGATVSAIAADHTDARQIYTAVLNAGLAYSDDGGATWQARAAADDRLRSISSLAVDPTDGQTIYAGTWLHGVLKSEDGGNVWNTANAGLPECAPPDVMPRFNSIAIDRSNPDVLYVAGLCNSDGSGFGVYRSTDAALSWTARNVGIASLGGNRVTVDPSDGNILYFSSNQQRLFFSTNAGATWLRTAAIPSPNAAFQVAIDPVHPATLYLAAFGVVRSVDRGATWEILRDHNVSPTSNLQQVALDPQRPHIVYAGDVRSGVQVLEVAPDLVLTIEGHSGQRTIGTAAQLVIVSRNAGPWAANGVRVTATLGSGFPAATVAPDRGACTLNGAALSCEPQLLRTGQSQRITLNYTPSAAGALALEASVQGHEGDANAGNNTAQASATAVAPPPIATPPPPQGGGSGGGSLGASLLALLLVAGGACSRRRLALAHFGR